jgi:hypothetical protein
VVGVEYAIDNPRDGELLYDDGCLRNCGPRKPLGPTPSRWDPVFVVMGMALFTFWPAAVVTYMWGWSDQVRPSRWRHGDVRQFGLE